MKKNGNAEQNELNIYMLDPEETLQKNAFDSSLDEMRQSDFAEIRREPYAKRKRNRKKLISGLISTLFILFCAGVFCYCAYEIVQILIQYEDANELYDDYSDLYKEAFEGADKVSVSALAKYSVGDTMKTYSEVASGGAVIYDPSEFLGKNSTNEKFQQMLVFLGGLKQDNPDTYGYIDIAGTRVSYPMVQSDNNDFYLTHSITGDFLKAGAIFVDFRNSKTLMSNKNTIIYGHNMENGSMFHAVTNYKDESFFRNKQIVITTFDGIYTFEVFSFYETIATKDYFRTYFSAANNYQDFIDFCTEEEACSMYHKEGIEFKPDSVIITLSTCITGVTNGRYCLHAILVNVER